MAYAALKLDNTVVRKFNPNHDPHTGEFSAGGTDHSVGDSGWKPGGKEVVPPVMTDEERARNDAGGRAAASAFNDDDYAPSSGEIESNMVMKINGDVHYNGFKVGEVTKVVDPLGHNGLMGKGGWHAVHTYAGGARGTEKDRGPYSTQSQAKAVLAQMHSDFLKKGK